MKRHPALRQAEERVHMAEFGVNASRLQPNPTLTLAVTAGDSGESANALTQNFEISGQPELRWRAAKACLEAAIALKEVKLQELDLNADLERLPTRTLLEP